jgi:hypothetical protein
LPNAKKSRHGPILKKNLDFLLKAISGRNAIETYLNLKLASIILV